MKHVKITRYLQIFLVTSVSSGLVREELNMKIKKMMTVLMSSLLAVSSMMTPGLVSAATEEHGAYIKKDSWQSAPFTDESWSCTFEVYSYAGSKVTTVDCIIEDKILSDYFKTKSTLSDASFSHRAVVEKNAGYSGKTIKDTGYSTSKTVTASTSYSETVENSVYGISFVGWIKK